MSQQRFSSCWSECRRRPSSLRVRVWRRLRSLGAVAAQALRLPAARHARAVRGLPVARAGDPARGWRRDPRPRPADRERDARRRAAGSSTSRATRTTASSPSRYRKLLQSLDTKSAATRARVQRGAGAPDQGPPADPRHRLLRRPRRRGGAGVSRRPSPCALDVRNRPAREPAHPRPHRSSAVGAGSPARGPHVDRIASAWLIKRFIDPDGDVRLRAAGGVSRPTRSRSTRPAWS